MPKDPGTVIRSDTDTIYIPEVPSPIDMDGNEIPKYFENITIQDFFYAKCRVLPEWYWTLICLYIEDMESAIQSLVPK